MEIDTRTQVQLQVNSSGCLGLEALCLNRDGKLPYGTTETVGLAQDGVGIAINDIYNKATPDSVKKVVEQARADVISCKVTVDTALTPHPCKPAAASTMAATMAATASK